MGRWCAPCAQAHPGAVALAGTLCEDCGQKYPNFGLAAEKRRRWCGGCAASHGAVNLDPRVAKRQRAATGQ